MGFEAQPIGDSRRKPGTPVSRGPNSYPYIVMIALALAIAVYALVDGIFGFRWSWPALAPAALSFAAAIIFSLVRNARRLEQLNRRQQTLLDAVSDGVCSVDANEKVVFTNYAAACLLWRTEDEIAGKPVHELLHGAAPNEQRCGEDCPLKSALAQTASASGEVEIFRAGGSSFAAEFSISPAADVGGFSGSVLSFRDVSRRSAADRVKDEFISTVSHELRSPLTSIRGALGLLSSGIMGTLNDKGANLLRIALTNSDRLVRLINDILDLEKIQSGREPLAFQPVQLGEIVQQAIEGMQPVADGAGVQLAHDSVAAEIEADPDRLLQVLTNLLSNAIKFSPAGSTVSVSLAAEGEGVVLAVMDQGRGIPEDKLEAIFGRFQQVDAADSREKGGSGLGLAICRTIVLQHSGRIWAERNPAGGSTFRVYLPNRPEPVEGPEVQPEVGALNGTTMEGSGT